MISNRRTALSFQKKNQFLAVFFCTAILLLFIPTALSANENDTDDPPKQTDPPGPVSELEIPVILVTKVNTEPYPIAAGETFNLQLRLKNIGLQHARRITVTLKSLEGETTLKYFSPVGQSNIAYLNQLNVNYENVISFDLLTSPGISGGIYNLVVELNYINTLGYPYKSSAIAGVVIQPKASLDLIELQYPKTVMEGEPFMVTGTLINSSSGTVRGVGVSAVSSEFFSVEQGDVYLGTFTEGASDYFEFFVIPHTTGSADLVLELYYTDVLQQKQVDERALNIEILPMQYPDDDYFEPIPEPDGNSFWGRVKLFVRALFGLGGV